MSKGGHGREAGLSPAAAYLLHPARLLLLLFLLGLPPGPLLLGALAILLLLLLGDVLKASLNASGVSAG